MYIVALLLNYVKKISNKQTLNWSSIPMETDFKKLDFFFKFENVGNRKLSVTYLKLGFYKFRTVHFASKFYSKTFKYLND